MPAHPNCSGQENIQLAERHRAAPSNPPVSADDTADHCDNKKESRSEKCCMDRGLDFVPRGDRLLRRYGSVLVHVSMRNTQICHVSPPSVCCGRTTSSRLFSYILYKVGRDKIPSRADGRENPTTLQLSKAYAMPKSRNARQRCRSGGHWGMFQSAGDPFPPELSQRQFPSARP